MSRDGKAKRTPRGTTVADLIKPTDPLAAMVANDVSEMRAGIERLVELATAQGQRMQNHLEIFSQHLASLEEHKARQGETTRLLAGLIQTLASHTDVFSDTVREAVENLALVIASQTASPQKPVTKSFLHVSDLHFVPGNHDVAAAVLDRAPTDTEDVLTLPEVVQAAQTVEPVTEETQPCTLERRRGRVLVSSWVQKRRPGQLLTCIRLPLQIWQECGFAADNRYSIRIEGNAFVVTRDPNGHKATRIGPNIVKLKIITPTRHDYERLNVLAGPGKIML